MIQRVFEVTDTLMNRPQASGMSSLFKCILMYQNHVIPPQAGMPHPLNPSFPPLDRLNINILSETTKFRSTPGNPRRILLNNFDAAVRLSAATSRKLLSCRAYRAHV